MRPRMTDNLLLIYEAGKERPLWRRVSVHSGLARLLLPRNVSTTKTTSFAATSSLASYLLHRLRFLWLLFTHVDTSVPVAVLHRLKATAYPSPFHLLSSPSASHGKYPFRPRAQSRYALFPRDTQNIVVPRTVVPLLPGYCSSIPRPFPGPQLELPGVGDWGVLFPLWAAILCSHKCLGCSASIREDVRLHGDGRWSSVARSSGGGWLAYGVMGFKQIASNTLNFRSLLLIFETITVVSAYLDGFRACV